MNGNKTLELLARIAENQERIITLLETNQARTERAIIRGIGTLADAQGIQKIDMFLERARLIKDNARQRDKDVRDEKKRLENIDKERRAESAERGENE